MALPVVWETDSSCRATVVVEAGARGTFSVQKNNTGYTRESLAIFFSPGHFHQAGPRRLETWLVKELILSQKPKNTKI
jgi:hypothetical protein